MHGVARAYEFDLAFGEVDFFDLDEAQRERAFGGVADGVAALVEAEIVAEVAATQVKYFADQAQFELVFDLAFGGVGGSGFLLDGRRHRDCLRGRRLRGQQCADEHREKQERESSAAEGAGVLEAVHGGDLSRQL
uniref:Uncharacterized protein n=1 Tax=mine drainage metagenome TaxID=410659 RepID=E6PXG5_9ZZZZ